MMRALRQRNFLAPGAWLLVALRLLVQEDWSGTARTFPDADDALRLVLLFLGWIIPILTMYLNINGIGVTPWSSPACSSSMSTSWRGSEPIGRPPDGGRPGPPSAGRKGWPEAAEILRNLTDFGGSRLAAERGPPI
jgi:hypothetical protein